jgi:hypothetical protein
MFLSSFRYDFVELLDFEWNTNLLLGANLA